MIKWVLDGKVSKLLEVRGKVQEVLTLRQLFNPLLFVMHNAVLCYNRHTDPAKPFDALHICRLEMKLKEEFQTCHEGMAAGHRGINRTLDKFQRRSLFFPHVIKSEDRWNIVTKDVNAFIFFFNNRFVMKTMTKN